MTAHELEREQPVAAPLGFLGEAAHRAFVRRDLARIFDYRRDAAICLLGREATA